MRFTVKRIFGGTVFRSTDYKLLIDRSYIAKSCHDQLEQFVYVNMGMSQVQTVKPLIYNTAHAELHALLVSTGIIMREPVKDRPTLEVEAESIAYVVCQHFGIYTFDYSFAYVTGWSKNKETSELKSSLNCINKTTAKMINAIKSLSCHIPHINQRKGRGKCISACDLVLKHRC